MINKDDDLDRPQIGVVSQPFGDQFLSSFIIRNITVYYYSFIGNQNNRFSGLDKYHIRTSFINFSTIHQGCDIRVNKRTR